MKRDEFQVIAALAVEAKMTELEAIEKAINKPNKTTSGALHMTRNAMLELVDTLEDELFHADAGVEG